ncbi:MAG TPA: hypothetical protein VF020_23690, partial [Chthoniobacterales bacterium]
GRIEDPAPFLLSFCGRHQSLRPTVQVFREPRPTITGKTQVLHAKNLPHVQGAAAGHIFQTYTR